MTSIGIARARQATPETRSGSMLRQVLLVCGILSSLLYVTTDILGGLQYDGYSFFSQAISELAAIGAPTKPLVDVLFLLYGPLALAFAVGVLWKAGQNRPLTITGILLLAYLAAGAGFALFPITEREAADAVSATPHIVVAAVVVSLMVLAMSAGALAFGRRFRIYSFLTLLTLIASFALTIAYVPRVAARLATPGLGIAERVNVYAMMLWAAVLATELLRSQPSDATDRLTPDVRRTGLTELLLLCGIVSSLLYVATDVLGGLQYAGYSVTSQAISELMAIGAPSERFVDPLFIIGGILAVAFGAGVLRSAGSNRALRAAGVLLIVYAAIGFTGPTLFEMHQRGTASAPSDLPHIILTAALVLCTLLPIGFAAAALGGRFRVYSFATLLALIVLGVLTAPYGAKLAAGQPTPGFGIVERILVYSSLLWFAVFAVALLRRPSFRTKTHTTMTTTTRIDGLVAPGFEEVRTEFARNFAERGDIGAAVAAYWRGEKVVDLWGGRRVPDGDELWNADTMVAVMSTTKGMSALTLALANARGWLDYEAPVARYWPEFAQNGKGAVTVRQVLGHEAGLVLLDESLTIDKLHDLDYVARVLARQKPAWPPGTRHGYHTMTVGLYMQEIMRRVDPAHRTIGRVFHEEIAVPLNLECYIGLPPEIPGERIAKLQSLSLWRGLKALRYTRPATTMKMIRPGSLLRRSLLLLPLEMNNRRSLEIEVPAGNGVGTARAFARAYSVFAEGGAELGITPETFARITEPPAHAPHKDVVLGVPSYFSLGFLRPGPEVWFGSTPRAFGAPGAGGSFAFADPDARLGYAYVMNKLDFYLENDPREKALRDAVYRAIARSAARTRAVELVAAAV